MQIDIEKHAALSYPTRVNALKLLLEANEEMCVGDMCDRLGLAQSKLSHHLKGLLSVGLVSCRSYGRWNYYTVNRAAFVVMATELMVFCGELEDLTVIDINEAA